MTNFPALIGVDAPVYLGLILILFAYAMRYYIFSPVALSVPRRRAPYSAPSSVTLSSDAERRPFVSILLPLYNERNVVNRLLTACSSLDYENYEVIVIDDSTDETPQKLERWKGLPALKIIHRDNREGWKAGALNMGIANLDPRSEYVLVFDADFVPKKDIVQRFLNDFNDPNVEAVQGYQKHDLNADENWITKALRIFHSTAYKLDLEARSQLRMMVPVMGSVFMLRTSIAREYKFEHDITEDYNLGVRLYLGGHRVVYDSSLAVSGECPSTLNRTFKQIGRWAEGTTRNTRKYFFRFMRSENTSLAVKFDFVMSGGSYLSSLALLVATVIGLVNLAYLVTMGIPFVQIPSTNPAFAAAIILSTMALPAASIAQALSLYQDSVFTRIKTIPYSLLLSYILIPITSYYSLKGLFFEGKNFERTFKTGKVVKTQIPALIPELVPIRGVEMDQGSPKTTALGHTR